MKKLSGAIIQYVSDLEVYTVGHCRWFELATLYSDIPRTIQNLHKLHKNLKILYNDSRVNSMATDCNFTALFLTEGMSTNIRYNGSLPFYDIKFDA